MAEMGDGYGSECHLLRFLGRHRDQFDRLVLSSTGAYTVRWLDFHFDPTRRWQDGERKGLDFLPPDHPAVAAWTKYWPQRGSQPNWDAVGVVSIGGADEWLLVEAKAHIGEMVSDCKASEEGGLSKIRSALDEVKAIVGVPIDRDWLRRYYQFANRLAVMNFLLRNNVPARLLFIYFVGDKRSDGISCPQTDGEWAKALQDQAQWLGITEENALSKRVHKMFLPIVLD
jgi:hypothetical protein